jgi:hypothetical protein
MFLVLSPQNLNWYANLPRYLFILFKIERKRYESTYVLIVIDDIYCDKRCCRDHDYCADNLDFGECKYGLCNFRLGHCNYRIGLCNYWLGLCNFSLGNCNHRLGLCNFRLGLCNFTLGSCNYRLGLRNYRLDSVLRTLQLLVRTL